MQDEIADSFDIEEVPTFLVLRVSPTPPGFQLPHDFSPFESLTWRCHCVSQGHTLLARHAGSNAPLLLQLIDQHSSGSNGVPKPLSSTEKAPMAPSTSAPAPSNTTSVPPFGTESQEQIEARCNELMNRHKVVLFMKGNPSAPKCGFSRQIVGLLRDRGVEFAWYDILSDQAVRDELKKMNDWPSELCNSVELHITSTNGGMPSSLARVLRSFPAGHLEWRAHWWFGHFQRFAREWRMGRDVQFCRVVHHWRPYACIYDIDDLS